MPNSRYDERRQHERYDTDLKISFFVNFDLETKIEFRLENLDKQASQIYTAYGHNINVEGLGFSSDIELKKGELLKMDVYLPSIKTPIPMEGRVMWCTLTDSKKDLIGKYLTGVRILKVNTEDVEKTIVQDPMHRISWSILLETVFGGFKESILKRKKG